MFHGEAVPRHRIENETAVAQRQARQDVRLGQVDLFTPLLVVIHEPSRMKLLCRQTGKNRYIA